MPLDVCNVGLHLGWLVPALSSNYAQLGEWSSDFMFVIVCATGPNKGVPA